jgi:hypothetical protein
LSAMPRSRPGSPRAGPDPHSETYRGASPRPARRAACEWSNSMPGTGITVLPCITPGYRPSGWTKPLSPGPKNFSISGGMSNFPEMALGTTGLNPDPEGLIFGVLSNFSQSGSTVYLSSAPGVSSASQPRSPCTSWRPHEGRRTCGLRRWYDSVNHHGGLLLLPETLIATSARPSIPALS